MKLKYEAPKRRRIKSRGFIGMTCVSNLWWWSKEKREWTEEGGVRSSHLKCRSVRAFRRRLKNAPANMTFTLVSKWKGFHVTGQGSKLKLNHERIN